MRSLRIEKSITDRSLPSLDKYLNELKKGGPISQEEEVELARLNKKGDPVALEKLIKANLRFVISVAKQYQGTRGIKLQDLIQAGNIGLVEAAKRFDETRGFKLISYAVWWIRQSITAFIAENEKIIRLPLNKMGFINKIRKASAVFEQEHEYKPSPEELSEILDIETKKITEILSASRFIPSYDAPLPGGEVDHCLLDVLSSKEKTINDSLMQESRRKEVKRVLEKFSERDREIIQGSFGIGCPEMTQDEIADKLDLSRERVRQLKIKIIKRLRGSKQIKRLLREYL